MIKIKDMTFRYSGREIFQNASVNINAGLKVGFVGKNGSGKTTLFKLIRREISEDTGYIEVKKDAIISYVSQTLPEGDKTLIDCVLEADKERTQLLKELEQENLDYVRQTQIHERLNFIDAYSAKSRAATLLNGLGFSAEKQEQKLNEFSGGWQMRVALARALFVRSDLLLLDEPTNHLDIEATMWLENYLSKYQGTLIIISHDRDLLNHVPRSILYLENKKLSLYGGNYDAFEQNLNEKRNLQAKAIVKQEAQKKHLESFVERFRYKATKAKQAQSRLKMLGKLEDLAPVTRSKSINLSFPKPEHLPPPVITLEKGKAGYGENVVLKNMNLRIDMDDRIALLGANGNGKSTLAKIISKRLKLMEGRLKTHNRLKIAYFAQHQTDELDINGTPYTHLKALMPDELEHKVKAYLGRFGFGSGNVDNRISELSGGEKARLLFAIMCHSEPHIIILDEPTNHLDIDTRKSLMKAINEFEGAVILIAHDLYLISHTAEKLWLVENGKVVDFEGDVEDYRKHLLQSAKDERKANSNSKSNEKTIAISKKDERINSAQQRAKLAPLKKEIATLEKQISSLENEKEKINGLLSDPELYERVAQEKITALQVRIGEIDKDLSSTEELWLEKCEKLETFS
jgi:ATP-binding cassette subfamily F protein 3